MLMKETEPKKDEASAQFKIPKNKTFIEIIDFFGHFSVVHFFI
jgi:hypothetical protein